MFKNINWNKELMNLAFILLGAILVGAGVVGFLSPNKIATGGTAGLAIVLYYLFKIPMGILLLLVNAPLLLVSIRYLGKQFAIRTILAILMLSISIDFFNEVIHLEALSENLLLSTIYGGLLSGLGIGLIFLGEASAGGGTIIAKIVCSKTTFKPGTIILAIDIVVVILAAVVFKNLELALWSMISIYATSKFIDLIVTGRRQNKVVHIASENPHELQIKILEEMGINGTIIQGDRLDYSHNRKIIFLSVNKNRIMNLKKLVQENEPNARMVVFEATELLSGTK
ncbi:MAG: YitT family protein [Flavobacteriales bacterium]|jgi:uncharacterized membrane-anchored protein YitT (DUF2179 family)|nr:YitT family protein [Flavobacteriales bacterium]